MGSEGSKNPWTLVFWVVFLGFYLNTKEKKIRGHCPQRILRGTLVPMCKGKGMSARCLHEGRKNQRFRKGVGGRGLATNNGPPSPKGA